jgi:hypothetical protein
MYYLCIFVSTNIDADSSQGFGCDDISNLLYTSYEVDKIHSYKMVECEVWGWLILYYKKLRMNTTIVYNGLVHYLWVQIFFTPL